MYISISIKRYHFKSSHLTHIPKKLNKESYIVKELFLNQNLVVQKQFERKLIDGDLHFSRKCHCLLIQWNWQITLIISWNFKRVIDKFIGLNSFAISR